MRGNCTLAVRLGIVCALGILSSAPAGAAYWSLFNIEGEGTVTADYVTYATRQDMLDDTNRTGIFSPNAGGFGRNVIGSGTDGTTYWSLFNIEGEGTVTADYVTYATLHDMLNDTNRTGIFSPNAGGVGRNAIGSGSDGTTYWSLFNIEDEGAVTADYVTYATLLDMLNDTNRTGIFSPNAGGFGRNVVGSGSDVRVVSVPATGTIPLLGLGIGLAMLARRARPRTKGLEIALQAL